MPDSQTNPKIFTLEEANALLPQVRAALEQLRAGVTRVLAQEATVDALELLAGDAEPTRQPRVADAMAMVEARRHEAQQQFETFERLGCHLKDLDLGLVDFCSRMDGDLVLLCWHEGEDRIRYWHTMEEGYAGRRSIPGT